MSEAAIASGGWLQFGGFLETDSLNRRENHLGDASAPLNAVRLRTQMNQDHMHFPAEIRINRTRGICNGQTVLQCQTASRSYLSLIALWDGEGQACWDENTCTGLYDDR